MSLCLHTTRNLTTAFYLLLLCQIPLGLAAPANNDHLAGGIDARAITTPDLSGAAGKIGAAAFGLVVLSLGFGLGAALIAILGSLEWREFRDRKKPKVPAKDGPVKAPMQMDEEKGVDRRETGLSEDTVHGKEKKMEAPSRRERSRLTLKSFMPMDFSDLKPGWLKNTDKT